MEISQRKRSGMLLNSPRYEALLLFSAAFVGGIVLLLWDPKDGFFMPCLLQVLTGLSCPGCGITRALHALVHGDFLTAFRYNFVGLPVLLSAGVIVGRACWIALKTDKWSFPAFLEKSGWYLLGIGALWMIVRNLAGL